MTMREQELTANQKLVLEFVRDFIEREHFAPTYDEIRAGVGFSTWSRTH
jgi:SOS-response transcriptional repressor LexA